MDFELALRRAKLHLGSVRPNEFVGITNDDPTSPSPHASLKPLPEPELPRPELQASSSSTCNHTEEDQAAQPPAQNQRFRKFRPLPVSLALEPERCRVIALWATIVASAPEASQLGRQLTAPEELATQIMKDVFGKKATSTSRSRAGSILGYVRWGKATILVFAPFPFREIHCYEFVCFLRAIKSPPSRAERFVQAVRFTHTLLGVDGPLDAISARVSGATVVDIPKKALIKKLPFSLEQVKLLEVTACGEPSLDSVFAGFICLLIYTRLRFSDAQVLRCSDGIQGTNSAIE